ncbi:C-8 sterol isomerase [Citrus sinensis]|nr:C-8 sterol isomerase [Citrus sinensis]
MKSLTPSSSVKSSATITTMDENQSEARDSCYYPGCKKDANCNCEICIASINATLDLMPFSVQKSSLTKLSASRGPNNVKSTPVSFEASVVSTPRSSSCKIMESPVLKSTARVNVKVNLKEMEKKETHNGFGFLVVFSKLVLVFSLFFAVEFGVSWTISGALKPDLSSDIVRNLGERSYFVLDLNGRLRFLQNELRGLVAHGKIFNCSCTDSKWEINQDGLLNSRCVLYKSAMEEVSIWGWPLQTAGLLTTGFSSRLFTILSGRVTEWSNGKAGYSIRKENTSWVHKKWGASVMQLDPNTWILEYRRNSILENTRLFSTALDFLKHRMSGAKMRLFSVGAACLLFQCSPFN